MEAIGSHEIDAAQDHSTDCSEYRYKALNGRNHIRRLILLPGDGALEGELEEVSLKDGPDYAALSYSWAMNDGDDSKSETIRLYCGYSCDDPNHKIAVSITRNLFDGLKRIRAKVTVSLLLWVDALCIDQGNTTERQQQVALMAQIYHQASLVVAWLGNDLEGEEASAAEMIREARDPHPLEVLGDGIMFLTNAFEILLAQRYFRRRWVVQELRHAKAVLICWAAHQADLEDFRIALRFHQEQQGFANSQVLSLFEENDQRISRDIVVCLAGFQDMECTDPRDRLYSLLSLDPECMLEADYSVSVEEVGNRLARYMWQRRYIEALLRNCRGAVRDCEQASEEGGPQNNSTSATWGIELAGGFNLPNALDADDLVYRPRQVTLREGRKRLFQLQQEGLPSSKVDAPMETSASEVSTKSIDDPDAMIVSLHLFGVVGRWLWGPMKTHTPREGYRELKGTSSTKTTIKVDGGWSASRVRPEYLQPGDLVCSAAYPTSFYVVLRQVAESDHYRIVGRCLLRTLNTERWCGKPVAVKQYAIV